METRCSCLPLSMTVVNTSLNRVCLGKIVSKLMFAPQTVALIRRKINCPSDSVKVGAQPQQRQQRQLQQQLLDHVKMVRFLCTGTHRQVMISYGEFDFPSVSNQQNDRFSSLKLVHFTFVSTNSPGYPTSWRTITTTPKFLYDSAEDCCNNYYGSFEIPMELCEMEDLCPDGKLVSVAADEPITTSTTTSTTITTTTSSPPSSSPTRNPTNLPTHSPSDSPTRNPTNIPTHSPSDSPTKRPSDKPVADVVCAELWNPVCGEDGVSYSNDCEANKVDVKVAYEGECEVPAERCSPGDKCSVEGSSCSVGTETCCGQTYDSLKCECSKGLWLCLVTEACMLPCSPTFAPTTVTRQPTPLPSKDSTNTPTMRPVDATTTTTTVAATTTTSGEMVTHSSGLCGKWHVSREAPSTW